MNQVVHIFKKDVRHLWIEIAISLALVAYMVGVGHVVWAAQGPFISVMRDQVLRTIFGLLTPLIIISWGLLVARAIHSEALVGDRQFWITRPYEWKKLLAAKLLFFAAFIYLPFFLMQVLLLARAGFSPVHWLPEMVLNLVFFSAIILVLAAAAAVTPNFGRVLLVLLGVATCLVLIFVAAVLGGVGMKVSTVAVSRPVAAYLIDAIALLLGCAVIVLQYRARRTKLAWMLLLAIPVTFVAIEMIAPDRFFMNHRYPPVANASGAPVQLSYDDVSGDQSLAGHETRGANTAEGLITIKFPIRMNGIADGGAIVFNEAKVSLVAANGAHWTSGWQGQAQWVRRPEDDLWVAEMIVPTKVFDKFEGPPVNLQLDVALTELKAGGVTQIIMPKPMKEIAVPDFGICAPQSGDFPDAVSLRCRFAWQPPFAHLSTRWFDEPCVAAKKANDPGIEGAGWVGSIDRTKGWMFFPVASPYVDISNSMRYDQRRPDPRYLCPGTPVTFTHYVPVRRAQESLTIQNYHLWTVSPVN